MYKECKKMAAIESNKIITRNLLVAPLEILCPGILLKNRDLDIDKKLKKIKTNYLLTDGIRFL